MSVRATYRLHTRYFHRWWSNLLLLLLPGLLWAQGETNTWMFGTNIRLDFSSGIGVYSPAGGFNALEGASSICDANGNLLFSTNGGDVYSANGNQMPNIIFPNPNLNGHSSSTQGALIVPKPGSSTIYYIFTTDGLAGPLGMQYSEVDMTLNGGNGDVTNNKNLPLVPVVTEKLAGIEHQNGTDYWVVTHEWGTNAFYAYPVTATGVGAPVISNSGSVLFGMGPMYAGYMKFNREGTKLVSVTSGNSSIELHDFDNATGVISNPVSWSAGFSGAYGAEFSPSGKFLYVSGIHAFSGVHQYDLRQCNAADIAASRIQVYNGIVAHSGGMQLGPDGKIYVARHNANSTDYLDIIHAPNWKGLACDYSNNAMLLTPFSSSTLSTPNFIASLVDVGPEITTVGQCIGDTTAFSLSNFAGVDSVHWNFGDPNSGPNNMSQLLSPGHFFASPDDYLVSAIVYMNQGTFIDTLHETILIGSIAQFSLGPDTSVCPGNMINLNINSILCTDILWHDSSTASTFVADTVGTYWVQVSNMCGVKTDTLTIDSIVFPPSGLDLGNDTSICQGQSVTLNASLPGTSYLWSDNSTDSTLDVSQAGTYWVRVSNQCGDIRDTAIVDLAAPPVFIFPGDTAFCRGDSVLLQAQAPLTNFVWHDGSTDAVRWAATTAQYAITATNVCGTFTDSVSITVDTVLTVALLNDTALCEGQSVTLINNQAHLPGTWSTGSTDSAITVSQTGNYWLELTNTCGIFRDTINVDVETPPQVSLGNDSLICSGDAVDQDVTYSRSTYLWNDGSTQAVRSLTTTGTWWVEVTNVCGVARDTMVLTVDIPLDVQLGPDRIDCQGQTIALETNLPATTHYQWNTGAQTPGITVSSSGRYWLQASNGCGTWADSVTVTLRPPPVIDLGQDTTLCAGEQLVLGPGAHATAYQWSTGSAASFIQVAAPGNYAVEVTNPCGADRDSINVQVQPLPEPELGRDTFVCAHQGSVQLTVTPPPSGQVEWSPGLLGPTLQVTEPGLYEVMVTDAFGCRGKDEVLVDA
ncbi:MAG: hypothetical protein AAGB22_01100, partial [Bacteroidota bacterium]